MIETPLPENSSIEALSPETIVEILANINTELKCATICATPFTEGDMIPVRDVVENLGAFDAFRAIEQKSLNILSVIRNTNPAILNVVQESGMGNTRSSWWVNKSTDPVGRFVTAAAGSLLHFSLQHKQPLRTVIGEKGSVNEGVGIKGRLAVIAALLSTNDGFTRGEVTDAVVEKYDIPARTAHKHLEKLEKGKLIIPTGKYYAHIIGNQKRQIMSLSELPGQSPAKEILTDFIKIIADFAIVSPDAIEDGIRHATAITTNAATLPTLIERSYYSSPHHGKVTTRSSSN